MIVTTEHERALKAATTYAACFTGTDLRRTIIVVGCYCIQVLSGNPLRAYATYFFQQAGLPTSQAFNMTIVSYVLGMVGVLIAVRVSLFYFVSFSQSYSVWLTLSAGVLVGSSSECRPSLSLLVRPCRHVCSIHFHWRDRHPPRKGKKCVIFLGHWRAPSRVLPHQQHHRQPRSICSCIRNSLVYAEKQVGGRRPGRIPGTYHSRSGYHAVSAKLVCVGLGCESRILLGRVVLYRSLFFILVHSRAKRSHHCGDGYFI